MQDDVWKCHLEGNALLWSYQVTHADFFAIWDCGAETLADHAMHKLLRSGHCRSVLVEKLSTVSPVEMHVFRYLEGKVVFSGIFQFRLTFRATLC